jgi:hypothetical protein
MRSKSPGIRWIVHRIRAALTIASPGLNARPAKLYLTNSVRRLVTRHLSTRGGDQRW